jgi:predicted ribosome quality control (RQC) complex YloA/Tae2 family protein
MIQVSLDPKLSPAENAQRYFKRFRKAKAGLPKIQGRLAEVRTQLKELESLRRSLQAASKKENVEDIAARLGQLGLRTVPPSPRRSVRGKQPASRPLTISLDQGWTILVGRNNRENDLLTHAIARPGDLWFHAQGVPGSHVILRREERKVEPSKRILEETASVAAYFSRARHSKTVPVVYTEKRYVRKPKGAKPGSAVVEREKTLFVKPKPVGRDEKDHK